MRLYVGDCGEGGDVKVVMGGGGRACVGSVGVSERDCCSLNEPHKPKNLKKMLRKSSASNV